MNTRKILAALIIALTSVALQSCGPNAGGEGNNSKNSVKIPNVSVEEVITREMVEKVILPGLAVPDQDVIISAEVGGIVERIPPAKADFVKKGAVLAEINRQQLKTYLDQAQAALRQARLSKEEAELGVRNAANGIETAGRRLEQAKLALKQAERIKEKSSIAYDNQKKHFERVKKLFNDKLVSQAAYDDAESLLKSVEADFSSAQAGVEAAGEAVSIAESNISSVTIQLESAHLKIQTAEAAIQVQEAALSQAKLHYEKGLITAPFDAYVDDIFLDEGEFAKMEAVVMKLIKTDPVKVKISLAEKDISHITTGQQTDISIGSLPGSTFGGTVSFVGLSSDTRTNTYPVEITVHNPKGLIKPGMITQVTLIRKRVPDAVSVPSFSVVIKEKGNVVFVLQDGHAVRKNVVTGILENGWIQIVTGLSPGELLITKGHRDLEDGQEVRVL